MAEKIERPEIVTDEHLEYLDKLHESGKISMFDAVPYVTSTFRLDRKTAHKVLFYWIETFGERHE